MHASNPRKPNWIGWGREDRSGEPDLTVGGEKKNRSPIGQEGEQLERGTDWVERTSNQTGGGEIRADRLG